MDTPSLGDRNDSTKANPTQRAGHPPDISCGPSAAFPAPVGEIFILTPTEITTLGNAVAAMNAYAKTRATAAGFGYLDPNIPLDSLKQRGEITPGPNFASPNLATAPYGKWISLDGVHPSSAAHQLLTNYLIDVINAKYGTSLVKLPNP